MSKVEGCKAKEVGCLAAVLQHVAAPYVAEIKMKKQYQGSD